MSSAKKQKKAEYFEKLIGLFQEYKKMFIVGVDMVGSRQIQNVRLQIRGKGEMLMGKNTMVRKCLREHVDDMPHLESVIPWVEGNSGFLFIKDNFEEIQKIIKNNFVGAAARAGVLAPIDVTIPKGVTTLQPTETQFFQALNISTKITKGNIEILSDVELLKKGRKVMPGEAALLSKLGIRPFTYGLEIQAVYEDGQVYDAGVLAITDESLVSSFKAAVRNVASVSLAAGYPTLASVVHSFTNGYKNVLSIAVATDYTYPLCADIKKFLSDPNAMAAASAAAPAPAAAAAAAKAPEPEPEPEEEDVSFDLFD